MADTPLTSDQAAQAVEQEARNIIRLVEYFDHLDATSPMMRFIIAGSVVGVSLLLLLIFRLIIRIRRKRTESLPDEKFKPLRWQKQDLLSSEDMKKIRLNVWLWLGRILTFVFFLIAVIGALLTSKWTLEWAARLIALLIAPLKYAVKSGIEYIPNLLTILVILALVRFLIRIIGMVFQGIKRKRIRIPNFYPEWADPSFGLVKVMIWVLTAVIVFPYLPGSGSPAFQGISIFLGVLLSLGSTTAVANVIAGTVLTYTRAFRVGDQVTIADTRGRIVERSTFVTRIQTLKNVIVSIPNSKVLTNNMINFSQNMGKSGVIVHTTITIGYDVPWQTVNKLLIAAALKTENILAEPEPFVHQTSLNDNYVSYEINGWTQHTEQLSKIYSGLHANILDEFHSNKVEILSPAYRASRDGNASTIPPIIGPDDDGTTK
jgi:small-conductance mechanosensitive channel